LLLQSRKSINRQVMIKFRENSFKQDRKYFCLRCTISLILFGKEELPDQWKESIIEPGHKMGDKTDYNNYREMSLPSTSYKILLNILLSRLSLCIDEIIGDHQCGSRRNGSTNDQIFCIRQILEKKWEHNNETVH
jgi:hypothetical protein